MSSLWWTPERVARLSELWREGASARLIGVEMGTTKSAVVGKARREGLADRGSPILRVRTGWRGPAPTLPKVIRVPATVAEAVAQIKPISESVCQAEPSSAPVSRWATSQAQAKADQRIRRESGKQLLPWAIRRSFLSVVGMRFGTCQFIEGEPSADDACKCGAPAQEGSSYCADHHRRCWVKPPPRKAA